MDDRWMIYPRQTQVRTRRVSYNKEVRVISQVAPPRLERTTVSDMGNRIEVYGSRRLRNVPETPIRQSWKQILCSFPDGPWVAQWLRLPPRNRCAITAKTVGVSDGSYMADHEICSCAWIIDFGYGQEAVGGGIVPGPEGANSSFRAELGGLYGQILAL